MTVIIKPLMACINGCNNMVEILMIAGADETITNDEVKTTKQMAVKLQ